MEIDNHKKNIAFFAGLSAFLAVFENLIPTPLPIFRLGISNIPVCLGFTLFNFKETLFIVVFKTVFSHFFRGTLFSYPFLIGITGSVLFIFFTFPFFKILKNHISFISVSVIGAFFHNLGQIAISFLFLQAKAVFYFAILLFFSGLIFGFINGMICNIIYNRLFKRFFYDTK